MKISKELEWIGDYIELVKHLLPNLKRLSRVSIRKASKKRIQRSNGMITRYDNKTFSISIYGTYSEVDSYKPLRIKINHYSTIDILCYLAHELAHLEHWFHTPEHKQLESTIVSIFMTHLKSNGYSSEEDENENLK